MLADIALSTTEELCSHLPTSLDIRASLRGIATNLQPTDNSAEVSHGSEKAWWRFLAKGAISVQHEGMRLHVISITLILTRR
jgi:hypothetical protein